MRQLPNNVYVIPGKGRVSGLGKIRFSSFHVCKAALFVKELRCAALPNPNPNRQWCRLNDVSKTSLFHLLTGYPFTRKWDHDAVQFDTQIQFHIQPPNPLEFPFGRLPPPQCRRAPQQPPPPDSHGHIGASLSSIVSPSIVSLCSCDVLLPSSGLLVQFVTPPRLISCENSVA